MTDKVMSLAVTHVLALALDQRLGGQHMLDLRRADPVRQRPEGAMCGRVGIPADHGHPRQGPALLRANDVDDALPHVGHGIVVDPEILGVLVQRRHLDAAVLGHRRRIGAVQRRRDVMVRHRDGLFRRADLAAGHPQSFEGLWAGHFVDQMPVDVEEAGAILGLMDDMVVPDLVIKRTRSHGSHLFIGMAWGKKVVGPGARSGAGEHIAGHAEEAGRKPRMIGDVEEDEPGHGGDIRANPE
jgi:hypothetical protein